MQVQLAAPRLVQGAAGVALRVCEVSRLPQLVPVRASIVRHLHSLQSMTSWLTGCSMQNEGSESCRYCSESAWNCLGWCISCQWSVLV